SLVTSAPTPGGSDAVVAAIPKELGPSAERGGEAALNQSAVRLGPADSKVVLPEVIGPDSRLRDRTGSAMVIHIRAQGGFTQAARPAVNEHDQLVSLRAESLEFPGVQDFLDRLQFGKMIPATDGAQGSVELCRIQPGYGQ